MRRLSISRAMFFKRRRELLTGLAFLIIITALFQSLVLSKPNETRAASVIRTGSSLTVSGGYIAPNGNVYSVNQTLNKCGQANYSLSLLDTIGVDDDVRIIGSVIVIGGGIRMKSLRVLSYADINLYSANSDDMYSLDKDVRFVDACPGSVPIQTMFGALYSVGIVDINGVIQGGAKREINFNISGDFYMQRSSQIIVDSSGYLSSGSASFAGAGGSHGGRGGFSEDWQASNLTYDSVINPILPGGGGVGVPGCAPGRGGGVVIIRANNIEFEGGHPYGWFISARGGYGAGKCGGGAGGSINLVAENKIMIPLGEYVTNGLPNGTIEVVYRTPQLMAQGGPGDGQDGGDGGGGRISIQAKSFSGLSVEDWRMGVEANPYIDYTTINNQTFLSVFSPYNSGDLLRKSERGSIYIGIYGQSGTITKKITSVGRIVDGASTSAFSSTALQKDDIIQIDIDSTSLTAGTPLTITDSLLKTLNSVPKKCGPIASTFSADPVNKSADPLVWNLATPKVVYYQCKVE